MTTTLESSPVPGTCRRCSNWRRLTASSFGKCGAHNRTTHESYSCGQFNALPEKLRLLIELDPSERDAADEIRRIVARLPGTGNVKEV